MMSRSDFLFRDNFSSGIIFCNLFQRAKYTAISVAALLLSRERRDTWHGRRCGGAALAGRLYRLVAVTGRTTRFAAARRPAARGRRAPFRANGGEQPRSDA